MEKILDHGSQGDCGNSPALVKYPLRDKNTKLHPQVLLNTRTGDLYEAYRITFLDQDGINSTLAPGLPWQFAFVSHDGWIVKHPKFGEMGIFFNLACEAWLEDLGEL